MKVAIVTDSTADIPPDLVDRYSIHVIRNFLIIEGQSFEDGTTITREAYYYRLPGMKTSPTTATASAGVYGELYEKLATEGAESIFSIHTSASLSGILNAVNAAAQSFSGRVHIFDSLSTTMGLGFQVLAAAEAAAEGATTTAVQARLERLRPRTRVIAMLDTLEFIRRSGRVSWTKARLGDLLRIKPFVEVNAGTVQSLGEVRTRSKGLARLKDLLAQSGPIERLAVLHTNAEEEALQFLSSLELPLDEDRATSKHPLPPRETVRVVNVTPIIGTHAGPNAIGYAIILR